MKCLRHNGGTKLPDYEGIATDTSVATAAQDGLLICPMRSSGFECGLRCGVLHDLCVNCTCTQHDFLLSMHCVTIVCVSGISG